MNLEIVKQGLKVVIGMGVSIIVAGIVDRSRDDLNDGKVVNTLVKLGGIAIAGYVADKVADHIDKRIDETVLAIKESKEDYENYKVENEA